MHKVKLLQEPELSSVLFSMFMKDLNDEIKHTVIKFADNIKLEGCMKTVKDTINIQKLSEQTEDKIWFNEDMQYTVFM